ncbi:MAG TPA: hypothetical protein VL326_08335 [Kofleriaceae bacterium]|nr:hypothetical protein [Kofleriaceae bacterium]
MAMKDADADSDGDGVGDGCDPDSDVSHPPNHIVLFEGFKTKPAGNAAFTETGSQWTFDGDAVASLTANNQRLTIGWPSPTSFFFVYTSVQWVSDPGPTTGAGTFLLSSPGQNDGWGCLLWDQGGATPRVLALVDLPTTVGSGDTVAFDYDTGGSYQARVGFNPATSTVSCSLQATAMSSPSSTGAPVNAAAGVTANGMKAKFHWVMIVN